MSDYVFTMIQAAKFYGPERKGARQHHARVPAGREDRRAQAERRRQVDAARIMAGNEETSSGQAQLAPVPPSACSSRSPSSTRTRPCARTSRTASARCATSSTASTRSRPSSPSPTRLRRAAGRAGPRAGADRPHRRLVARPDARPRDGCAPAPGGRPRRGDALGRRAAARRALPAAPGARPPAPRRAHEPSRRRVGRLARALPRSTKAPSSPSHTTSTSSTTSRAGSSSSTAARASVRGNYSSWLEQKQARLATEEKQKSARRRALARELEWVRASPKARHAKSKARLGAYERLLAEEQAVKLDRVEIHIPAGRASATSWSRRKTSARATATGSVEDMSFSLPPGGIVGVVGPNGAGKTTLFRMIAGDEWTWRAPRRPVEIAYVDQSRGDLAPAKTVWQEISGGHDTIELGKREVNFAAVRLLVQLQGLRPAEARRRPLRRRAEPRPPREAPPLGRQPPAPRRADERPRRGHAAGTRGRAPRLRGLRRRDLARPLVPRPDRDASSTSTATRP